jgi:hypothetical protein
MPEFLELGQQPSGLGDLPLLPSLRRILALVVPAEQEDRLVAVEVDEDPKQDINPKFSAA